MYFTLCTRDRVYAHDPRSISCDAMTPKPWRARHSVCEKRHHARAGVGLTLKVELTYVKTGRRDIHWIKLSVAAVYGEALDLRLRVPRPGLRGPRDSRRRPLCLRGGAALQVQRPRDSPSRISRAVPRTRARRVLSLNVQLYVLNLIHAIVLQTKVTSHINLMHAARGKSQCLKFFACSL